MTKLTLDEARELVIGALLNSDVSRENAGIVADALVAAEAAGQGGHGLRRVPAYAAQARAGKTAGHAKPSSFRVRPGVLRIDAQNGFAYPAFDLALEEMPGIAREQGIALAAINRSHHAGVMGLTVERFAEAGLVAIMVANAPAAMAPWGGHRALYGTNPLAFAAPVEGDLPIVIDLALSKVARGKIMAAQQKGAAIPDDWAFDVNGNPTTDADAAMAGTMAPLGGAKGAALALMVELLAAGLTGANYAFEASSLFTDQGPPPSLGQTIIAIDPGASADGVAGRMKEMAEAISNQEGVRIPGRRGQGQRASALRDGLDIDDEVVAAIRAIG